MREVKMRKGRLSQEGGGTWEDRNKNILQKMHKGKSNSSLQGGSRLPRMFIQGDGVQGEIVVGEYI